MRQPFEGELRWVKSSHRPDSGAHIEVAQDGDSVYIRNTAYPDAPWTFCSYREFQAFVAGARGGEFE